jgi:3'-phosphoadenosine 5'-phosphosulfate sulfotransferase (PAPS reductase)/FAD synthetase
MDTKEERLLEYKIEKSLYYIKKFYNDNNGKVYVSFSGGKDSTVLLHLVRSIYPEAKGVFINTGVEFPEIKKFVRGTENIISLRPNRPFHKIIKQYGYPVISKENAQKIYEIRNTKSHLLYHNRLYGNIKGFGKLPEKWKYLIDAPFKISDRCCYFLKKAPFAKYKKITKEKPYIGTMAYESRARSLVHKKIGCNSEKSSRPLSFWVEKDIWDYIKKYNIKYSSIYDKGRVRTGCMYCLFGYHLSKENRIKLLKKTHPIQYNYMMDRLGYRKILPYLGRKDDNYSV